MIHENSQPRNRMPAWVAGAVVLLLLAGSAWALYKLVFNNKSNVAVESVPVAPGGRGFFGGGGGLNGRGGPPNGGGFNGGRFNGGGGMPEPNSVASVSKTLTGRIRARHGGVVVYGIPRKDSGYDAVIEYEDARTWVTPPQWDAQLQAGKPGQYSALAEKIGLTAEQKQKLEALKYQPPLSDAEKKDFDRLFTNWIKAPDTEKDPAAEELSRAVESAAAKHLAEAKAALLKRCNEVVTILSEQQMQQIHDWFNSPSPQTLQPRQGRGGPPQGRGGGGFSPRTMTTQPARPTTAPVR